MFPNPPPTPMTTLDWLLFDVVACEEARDWARGYPTLDAAWAACPRGDWMLWLAARAIGEPGSDAHRRLVLAACECARTALPYVPAGEDRPIRAIEIAERWARREAGATIEHARTAAAFAAAYAAYAASTAASAARAAFAAASAARAADAAAADAAADAVAYAAASAARAADAAAADAAADAVAYAAANVVAYVAAVRSGRRSEVLAILADLVRQHYPTPPQGARTWRPA